MLLIASGFVKQAAKQSENRKHYAVTHDCDKMNLPQ
jgi:hypothetical protein